MIGVALGSWLVAFLGATLAGTLLWVLGGWGFLQGAFVGLVVFIVFGTIISWVMTRPLPGPNELELTTPPAPGTGKSAPTAAAPKAKAPAAAPAPSKAKAPTEEKAAAPSEAPKAAATASDARPALMMDAPEAGKADDLKKITGVGPKLEQTLNELGIWHYHQVAKLTKKEIAWVDERLRFKGRIERDDWVGQARELAKGKG
jgi:predicted flap endonuclease-1-like 5' DNA nuclease